MLNNIYIDHWPFAITMAMGEYSNSNWDLVLYLMFWLLTTWPINNCTSFPYIWTSSELWLLCQTMDFVDCMLLDELEDDELFVYMECVGQQSDHLKWPAFCLENFSDEECVHNFRFHKRDVLRLMRVLGLPNVTEGRNRIKWTGVEGLCILLRRLVTGFRKITQLLRTSRWDLSIPTL